MHPTDQICAWVACRPDLFPTEHRWERRTADRHFAIRWTTDETMRLFVNEVREVEADEAMAGEAGRAVIANYDETGRVHYCGCGTWHICRRVERGMVKVEITHSSSL